MQYLFSVRPDETGPLRNGRRQLSKKRNKRKFQPAPWKADWKRLRGVTFPEIIGGKRSSCEQNFLKKQLFVQRPWFFSSFLGEYEKRWNPFRAPGNCIPKKPEASIQRFQAWFFHCEKIDCNVIIQVFKREPKKSFQKNIFEKKLITKKKSKQKWTDFPGEI